MQTLGANLGAPAEPLYVRWGPEQSSYAIEIKLEVMEQISRVICRGDEEGFEAGGLLIGVLQPGAEMALRIDEMREVPHKAGSIAFFLDPKEPELLRAVQTAAKDPAVILGVFRGHRRSGPLQPSLADQSAIAQQLGGIARTILLLAETAPHGLAGLFVANEGKLGDQPAVTPFVLDPKSLARLPEVTADPGAVAALIPEKVPSSNRAFLSAAAWLAIALITAVYAWSTVPGIAPGENMRLEVSGRNPIQIHWDRTSRFVQRAEKGTIVAAGEDGSHKIQLSEGDLRTGSVAYQPSASVASIQLMLQLPDGYAVAQKATRLPGGWQVVSPAAAGD